MTQSKMLYDTFALEEKSLLLQENKRFNTLRHLCDGKEFSERDKLILSKIIEIGDKQNSLIEEKNWCTDSNALSTLLSKYSAHLKILKLANEKKELRQDDLYRDYVFPIELPGAIESQILSLLHEKELLLSIEKPKKSIRIKRYDDDALSYYNQTISLREGEDLQEFKKIIKSGCFVCDLGCGSGRDSVNLIKSGFRVYSTEPSAKLAQLARSYPFIFVKEEPLQFMKHPGEFDAIWCSAVLQHIPLHCLRDSIQNLSNMLTKNGIIYLSFRTTVSYKEEIYSNMSKHDITQVKSLMKEFNLLIFSQKESESRKDGSNQFFSCFARKELI